RFGRLGELLAPAPLELPGLLVEVVALAGQLVADAGQGDERRRVLRVHPGLADRRLLLLLQLLVGAGAVARAAGEPDGVEQAAGDAAADPEQDETATHQDREGQVDRLNGAAAAAASEVKQHRRTRLGRKGRSCWRRERVGRSSGPSSSPAGYSAHRAR